MKISTLVIPIALAGFCFTVNAAVSDNIVVYSTEKANGSISAGKKNAYTKTFEITVAKLAGEDVDLSELCLKAYTPDNKFFRFDTVDEKLSSGKLQTGKSVTGIAVFTSENDAVSKASMVKISGD